MHAAYPIKKGVVVLDNVVGTERGKDPCLPDALLLLLAGHALKVDFLHGIGHPVHLSDDLKHNAIAARSNLFLDDEILCNPEISFLRL